MIIKRVLDIIGSFLGSIILFPFLLIISLAILVTMGRPIFFCQWRAGLSGQKFRMVKFRTMRPPQNGEVWYVTDIDRTTSLGRFLRRLSIDELPELWNVLKGQMSLVGPRPLLLEYLPRYTAEQNRRHEMRPGLTGWAQINGRQDIPFSERLKLDVWYVDNWSLMLDLRILFATLGKVISSNGVKPEQTLAIVDDIGLTAANNLVIDGGQDFTKVNI